MSGAVRGHEDIEAIAAEVGGHYIHHDVTDEEGWKAVIAETGQRFGRHAHVLDARDRARAAVRVQSGHGRVPDAAEFIEHGRHPTTRVGHPMSRTDACVALPCDASNNRGRT